MFVSNYTLSIVRGRVAMKLFLCVLYFCAFGFSKVWAQMSPETPPQSGRLDASSIQSDSVLPDTTLSQEARQQAALQEFLTAVALAKNNLGAIYYAKGQYDSARVHIEHALEVAPGFAAANLTLGLVHHAKGNINTALAAFKKAVEGDTLSAARMSLVPPDSVYAWARSQFDKLLAGPPELAVAHTAMAIVYNQGGYLNEAVHHYRQAIENDPQYVDAYTNLGKVYTDTEEYEKAVDTYEKVLTLSPPVDQVPKIHLNLGVSYLRMDRIDSAIVEWKKAIKLSPNYMDAYMNLGTAYQNKNMPDSTRVVWERALEISPKSVVPHVALARLASSEGRLSDAAKNYRELINMGASDPRIYAEMGLIYERMEDFGQAIKYYEQALELAPETTQLKAALTRVNRITKDRAEAIDSNKIRVRQIVVVSRKEANVVMEQLKNGADFVELARERSIDSSRDRGGDLGFFGLGEMIPEFEKEAIRLKVGELSEVVQTPMGFHIIKRIE